MPCHASVEPLYRALLGQERPETPDDASKACSSTAVALNPQHALHCITFVLFGKIRVNQTPDQSGTAQNTKKNHQFMTWEAVICTLLDAASIARQCSCSGESSNPGPRLGMKTLEQLESSCTVGTDVHRGTFCHSGDALNRYVVTEGQQHIHLH